MKVLKKPECYLEPFRGGISQLYYYRGDTLGTLETLRWLRDLQKAYELGYDAGFSESWSEIGWGTLEEYDDERNKTNVK